MIVCGFRWPWLTVTPETIYHVCGLVPGHLGDHVCRCSLGDPLGRHLRVYRFAQRTAP